MSDRVRSIPTDALRAIFSREVMAQLAAQPQSERLAERLRILNASRPLPSDRNSVRRVKWLLAHRVAWDAYVEGAFHCGLFDGKHGEDLRARLADHNQENFRAALAECEAAWFLACHLQLSVSARPAGRASRPLDLLVALPGGDVNVEVKSPFREPQLGGGWVDDSDILERCLADASKQFDEGRRNLLLLVGRLTLPIEDHRRFFSKAFYADQHIAIRFDSDTGEQIGHPNMQYTPNGKFLKQWGKEGTRHKRVSGVLFVQETFRVFESMGGEWKFFADHDALMMHNPHAALPLPEEPWGHYPQFVRRGDELLWTDGHEV